MVGLFTLGGSSALVALGRGTIYRTDDAGETWAAVGRAPDISDVVNARAAALGPDGRLYVGLIDVSPERGWVWRTSERLTASVSVEAAPVGGPVVIGPSGGSFRFAVTLTNTTSQPQRFQAWSAVNGPVSRSPVLAPRPVRLPPGGSVTRTLVQAVPANAPAGTYTYTVNVGTFPDPVVSNDGFPAENQGAAVVSGAGGSEAWAVSGWDEPAEARLEAVGAWLSVEPNPFRDAAAVTLTLAQPAEVTVAVYDVLGRRVAVLHDGPIAAGQYQFVLDGSALPAGVYVVRAEAGGALATRSVTRLR